MDLLRSLPLGLYLEKPITWLHQIDPRVKLAWLMSFLAAPIQANSVWRVLIVGLLILLTLTAAIPLRVWRQQMGLLLMLSFFVLIIGSLGPDGLGVDYQPRLSAETAISNPSNYEYLLFQKGPVRVTRHSLTLAVRSSTLLFTLVYSSNLYRLTTAPEEITAGIERLMQPGRRLNWPVTEIALTLTLSLRFIPLVLEEAQNLIRSVQTRAINWKKLGFKGTVRVWLMIAERLLENLLLRAEQMANAMTVRGFTSPNEHRVHWHSLRLKRSDWIAMTSLVVFWGARLLLGSE